MTAVADAPPSPARPPADAPPAVAAPARPPRPPLSRPRAVVTWIALTIVGLVGWTAFYALVVSGLQERHQQSVLYSQLRYHLAAGDVPIGGVIEAGTPIALLSMPSAGLHSAVVVEGTESGDLAKGPGHKRNSAFPGQAGVAVVYGRATFFGGPFADIGAAKVGATITVQTGQGKATYRVRDVRRPGDPFPPAPATGRLILVTADGSGWRGGWASDDAVYVDADLVSKVQPTPGPRLGAVPESEGAMAGDPSALYSLVLWLPLLGVVGVALSWLRQRWGGWPVWVVGTPAVLAVLWGITQDAVRLLPNLL